jgi:hypothetical protein
MIDKIKHTKAEYIESGSYQGGEEEAWNLGVRSGDDCIVMPEAEFRKIELIFRLIESDDSGDIEFIKHQIRKILAGENA